VYLIYLGIKSLWTLRNQETAETVVENKYKNRSSFKQGFLTNLLNPKIAVFFLTFLPQFVNPGSHAFMPFLILGMTYIILTIVWYLFYIYLLNQISAFMKKPKTQKVIEGITGTILIGFGIKDKESFDHACRFANGAIIGTAFIKALDGSNNIEETIGDFVGNVLGTNQPD